MRSGTFLHSALLILGCLFVLQGCVSVTLISDYDETIDKGLTAYQEAMETQYAKIQSGAVANDYATSQNFYAEQLAKLTVLYNRALAFDEPAGCPTLGSGVQLDRVIANTTSAFDSQVSGALSDTVTRARGELDNFKGKDCTDIVFSLLITNHKLAEEIHKSVTTLTGAALSITNSTMTQSVRIALRNELGKKIASGSN